MSLRINHNLAALNAHRNLVNTNFDLSKSMQRLSSGYRINQGSDDPAGLVISEQFRAQIAGLNRAIQNSEGSISMIQTAEGALTEINSLLVSMRELAIHAANEGFNDADQLAADQAEIDNAIATIDRIAANTQFGTKKLLDGSKENVAQIIAGNETAKATMKASGLTTGEFALSAVKTADASASLNDSSHGISLDGTGTPYNLSDGVHTIDVVQSSDVAKKLSGVVAFKDAWNQDLTFNATEATAMVRSAQFTTAAGTHGGTYSYIINYQENGGTTTGNQVLSVAYDNADNAAAMVVKLQAAINANANLAGKLTVSSSADGANRSLHIDTAEGAQYSMRIEASTYSGAGTAIGDFTAQNDRGISDSAMNFTVVSALGTQTAQTVTIANGSYATQSALVTALNTAIEAHATFATATWFRARAEGTTGIRFETLDEGSDYSVQLNQTGGTSDDAHRALNLTVDTAAIKGIDARVQFDGYTNVITSVRNASTQSYTLKSAADGDASQGTVAVTLGTAATGINASNMLLTVDATKFDLQLNGGPATSATAGKDAIVWNGDRSEWVKVNLGLTSTGGNVTISNTDQSLVFQIGANVGQTERISLRNMASTALGKNMEGNMFTSLASIDVTTAQGAQDAQSIIDAAINEVSTTRGTLGSFQKNTLESNLRNLRIASQNLTASESMIRDTDMAKEMSEFTKNQILVQAGTSMLAQANQIPQVVLSLF